MAERDPIVDPMPGDVWSWPADKSPCCEVGLVIPGQCVWMNSTVDGLPLSRWDSIADFLKWAATATIISRGEEKK